MIPIAIQEDMLPGPSMMEKFEQARALGIEGIEFWGRGLAAKVADIAEAMVQTGVKVAAIHHGRQSRFLDPDPDERNRALDELRSTIMCASDLGARGVVVVPHYGGPSLPDLTPWMTPGQLQAELFNEYLRTLEDFADAMDVDLYIEPVNRSESHFVNRLEQAAAIAKRRNHRRVKIAADLYHMAQEEDSIPGAIEAQATLIGHVHLADNNRQLPREGERELAAVADALRQSGYEGWASLACGEPGNNAPRANSYLRDLPISLALLRRAGFGS